MKTGFLDETTEPPGGEWLQGCHNAVALSSVGCRHPQTNKMAASLQGCIAQMIIPRRRIKKTLLPGALSFVS